MNSRAVSGILLALLLTSIFVLAFNIQPVKTEENREPLFFDDFDDGVADGWTPQRGYTWEVIEGQYVSSLGSGRAISTVDNLILTDGIIKAIVLHGGGNPFQDGIVFRYTDDQHYYSFFISDEYDEVRLRIHNESDSHYGWPIEDWGKYPHTGRPGHGGGISYPIDPSVVYNLEVRVDGNNFTGYINGEKILYGVDDDFEVGSVGLAAHRGTVYFDNFTVYSIPKTIYVDDDNTSGPWDGTPEHPYQNITSGIEHGSAGDTIFVKNGTYYEHLVINKTLTLTGEDKDTTIIDGEGTEPASIVGVTADNVEIRGFTIRNSRSGGSAIWIDGYVNNTVSDNIVATKIGDGIRIVRSFGNTISDNIVKDNGYTTGIGFDWASNNLVSNNTIINNLYGIGSSYSCYNNVFIGNKISTNNYGIRMSIHDCTFYHNNIINNAIQVYIYSPSPANAWDNGYPSGGNYWSDYEERYPNALEMDDSGIWDTPYEIDENNQDNYPLMEPWMPLGVVADLVRRQAWSEHNHYDISKDEDEYQTLYAKVGNLGNQTVWVKGVFNITEDDGFSTVIESEPLLIEMSAIVELSANFGPLTNADAGKYYVSATCWYSHNKMVWRQGEKEKTFKFNIAP